MSPRSFFIHLGYGGLALLTLVSLVTTLFFRNLIWLGGAVFAILWISAVARSGFRRRTPTIPRWAVQAFLGIAGAAMITCTVLSFQRGAPILGNLPVFAERTVYAFSRAESVERWRFLAVGATFTFAWHSLLGIGIAEEWMRALRTGNGR